MSPLHRSPCALEHGFTLIELLVSMLFLSLAVVGMGNLFIAQNHFYVQQSTRATVQANLRTALDMLSDQMRNANSCVPTTNLSSWVTWVASFTTNPKVTTDADGNSVISIAAAGSQPVTTLSSAASAAATSIVVASGSSLNTTSKSLIVIGDTERAIVKGVSGTNITIDTDPTVVGNQGLSRRYPASTPIYRIDVTSFSVAADATGVRQLVRDLNQGAGTEPIAEGIQTLTLTTLTAGRKYKITLGGKSPKADPVKKTHLLETLDSTITMLN